MSAVDSALATLKASGLTEDEIARRLRGDKVSAARDHFAAFLKNDQGANVFNITISDARAIREFMKEPPTAQYNPGGQMFEDLKRDTRDAIAEKDWSRMLVNLLLIYKAVRVD